MFFQVNINQVQDSKADVCHETILPKKEYPWQLVRDRGLGKKGTRDQGLGKKGTGDQGLGIRGRKNVKRRSLFGLSKYGLIIVTFRISILFFPFFPDP
jgi:hypothetical protein